jgi:hypothetical protein
VHDAAISGTHKCVADILVRIHAVVPDQGEGTDRLTGDELRGEAISPA